MSTNPSAPLKGAFPHLKPITVEAAWQQRAIGACLLLTPNGRRITSLFAYENRYVAYVAGSPNPVYFYAGDLIFIRTSKPPTEPTVPVSLPQEPVKQPVEMESPEFFKSVDAKLKTGMSIKNVAREYKLHISIVRYRYDLIFNPVKPTSFVKPKVITVRAAFNKADFFDLHDVTYEGELIVKIVKSTGGNYRLLIKGKTRAVVAYFADELLYTPKPSLISQEGQ